MYLPVEEPTGDYYGGHRPGQQSLRRKPRVPRPPDGRQEVALPARASSDLGLRHPGRADPRRHHGGREGHQGGRRSHEARHPLHRSIASPGSPSGRSTEKPVEKGDVPGEWYSPTQPIPTKPPAYSKNGTSIDDLIDFTPELRAQAESIAARFKLGPIFTPPVVSKAGGPLATLARGPTNGGSNWPGGAFDPETHTVLRRVVERRARGAGTRPAEQGALGHGLDRRLRAAARWRANEHGRTQRPRTSALQAAVRNDDGDQPRQGRDRVAGPARRHAGRRAQSRSAQGT